MKQRELENEVMLRIIEGAGEYREKLAAQYTSATVADNGREFTGHGFFTYYTVADSSATLGYGVKLRLGADFATDVNGVGHGVDFVLYVDDGLITMLEGFTFGDEKWPNELTYYKIH